MVGAIEEGAEVVLGRRVLRDQVKRGVHKPDSHPVSGHPAPFNRRFDGAVEIDPVPVLLQGQILHGDVGAVDAVDGAGAGGGVEDLVGSPHQVTDLLFAHLVRGVHVVLEVRAREPLGGEVVDVPRHPVLSEQISSGIVQRYPQAVVPGQVGREDVFPRGDKADTGQLALHNLVCF